ncbi:MAG: hypothetical protein CM15mP129_03650 [Chloroflexota bacterium]|nr:MAG: hypothetical protein CM15mP129_03650 [Chloroflexota bacterium]
MKRKIVNGPINNALIVAVFTLITLFSGISQRLKLLCRSPLFFEGVQMLEVLLKPFMRTKLIFFILKPMFILRGMAVPKFLQLEKVLYRGLDRWLWNCLDFVISKWCAQFLQL